MAEIDLNLVYYVVSFFSISIIFLFLTPRMLSLQARLGVGQLRKTTSLLEKYSNDSRRYALKAISKYGKPKRDVAKDFDEFLEFFAIEPVSEDPAGVLQRLEYVLDVRQKRFQGAVARFAPNADRETAANLEMAMEGAMANFALYRIIRHFTVMAEKTKNMQIVMLVQMNIPFLKSYARAFAEATKAFTEGKPIGDGVGALTAARFIGEAKAHEAVEDTIYAETKFEGRKLILVKAKGPGGRVGKPGELIAKIAKGRKVARIIMIDAAGKLEGDTSGDVVEGVGAAIGGPPTEKYKIEQIAVARKIPVDAIIIKESFTEAIKPLTKRLAKGVDKAVDKVKAAIRERTKRGDVVIVAGIGNTIGIGQTPKELPKEFAPQPEVEKDELESAFLPFR